MIKQQEPKPLYSEIMRALGIEVIRNKKTSLCHYNAVNLQINPNIDLKLRNIRGIQFIKRYRYLLRYQDNHFFLEGHLQNQKRGISEGVGVTTNQY